MSMASVALGPVSEETLNATRDVNELYGPSACDPIVVFLSVAGSVLPLRIMESDSIASVKLRIQATQGFYVKKQKLVFEGRELARKDSSVKEYGVADGNTLHLILRLSDLQAITVRTVCGEVFDLRVKKHRNVGYVKQQIVKKGKGFDIMDDELVFDGEELEDQLLISDIRKNDDAVIHLLIQKSAKVRAKPVEKDFELSIEALPLDEKGAGIVTKNQMDTYTGFRALEWKPRIRDFLLEPLISNSKIEFPVVIRDLIKSAAGGLEGGKEPIRSSEGCGGAYFMQDSSGQCFVAVFKPTDEEPMAVNNPQRLPLSVDGEGLKRGTRVGQGALREVAAYILDHPKSGLRSFGFEEKGFAGVPPTVMVKCLHRGFNHPKGFEPDLEKMKVGSLQMFMENNGSCEDMGPQTFPVSEVHKISVLDIRLANADRHAGNILIRKEGEKDQVVLIPIDHGYCLPENFEDCTFDWLYWPQAREPYSPDTVEYIKALDAEQDIALLKFHGWDLSSECARSLRISTMLLKKGSERGLSPFTIGSIMCRETVNRESVIEQIVREAQNELLPGSREAAFLESVSRIMDRRLDEISGCSK